MSILVLTQTGGILKPFAIILGFIMNYIYRFLQIFGINNVALTIILFTLVINVLMIPLTVKQQKFSKMSSLMNPELQKVQKKYQNRKDEKSMRMMQAETQAIYDSTRKSDRRMSADADPAANPVLHLYRVSL